jgi:hypothetical protein
MNESWEETAENRKTRCDGCSRRRICPAAYNIDVICPDSDNIENV